ncbi:MAG TPA: hypothetical protein VGR46_09715 [Candidatus Limnocylindria bacterium]|jgi:hypothetical protein|nr:hypothetical protein [Candidatus Limnocylindria bacterium]HEV8654076.1 hypothetical protein [Candidatus Limnocylindria bacterium]
MTAARAPIRSLAAILFAALLALSLIATTVDALAATPLGMDRFGRESQARDLKEFFHGRGISWE